jgi:phage/plasmid-like protein (TIGR03299 family)
MMYVGETPWHGLGTALNSPATAVQAIKAAGLNWRVATKPLYTADEGTHYDVPGRFAVIREDLWATPHNPVLCIVGRGYKPLQNTEAFQFFDAIAGPGHAIYHTAGALSGGVRVWILAKLPGEIRVVGDDVADKYLLLSNSHDGSSSVQIKFTPVRVVCQNTLTMALRRGTTIRVTHVGDVRFRLHQASESLGIIKQEFTTIGNTFTAMAKIPVSKERLNEYLNLVFPNPTDPKNQAGIVEATKDRSWSVYFFENGKGNAQAGVRGTLWAAYNGVTEYVDQCQSLGLENSPLARTGILDDAMRDRRLTSAWFGEGYLTKAKAFRVADDRMAAWSNWRR